jgi:hypothetical protein
VPLEPEASVVSRAPSPWPCGSVERRLESHGQHRRAITPLHLIGTRERSVCDLHRTPIFEYPAMLKRPRGIPLDFSILSL